MIHKFWVVKSKFKLPGLAKTGRFTARKNASHALPKQRITALFFVCAFVLATLLPVFVSVNEAQAANSKPKPLAVAKQTQAEGTGAIGKGTTLTGPMPTMDSNTSSTAQTEDIAARTENSETFDIGNGQKQLRVYQDRVHYQKNGKWEKIDNSLIEDSNAADSTNLIGKAIAVVKGKTQKLETFKLAANDWQARFARSDDKVGMVRVESGATKLAFYPLKTAKSVAPTITRVDGQDFVLYKDIWNGVDLEYTVKGGSLKENIIIKNASAATNYGFKLKGGELKKTSDGGFDIVGTDQKLAPLSVTANLQGPVSEPVASQSFSGETLTVMIDSAWVKSQSSSAFPIVIDPTWGRTPNIGWNYTAYKSDGYVCSSSVCYMNAGTLSNNGWKTWRSVFWVDATQLINKQVVSAHLTLVKRNSSTTWLGTGEGLYYTVSQANCWGYNCINTSAPRHSAWFPQAGDIEMTALMQSRINAGDYRPTFILNGEERAYTTYKAFDADASFIQFTFNSAPGQAAPITPADKQIVVTDQPSLQVNPASDPEGDALQYYYRVATNPDAETGSVINSGWLPSTTQWTVPESMLQDGVTYYWHVYTYDGRWMTTPNWTRSFTVDMRTGTDGSASYDDGGPVDVNLATGNVTTNAGTHSIAALGGNIGLSLEYNSPYRSKQGLTAKYYNNLDLSGSPVLTRTDANVDFAWAAGSPAPGVVNGDNFTVGWSGFFVAPETATYELGCQADDGMEIWLKGQKVRDGWAACGSGYGTGVLLTAGEVAPILVKYKEIGGYATAKLWARRAGKADQIVPANWLRTEPKEVAQNNGLMGKYYSFPAGTVTPVFPTDEFSSFAQRRETNMYFNWGAGSAVPTAPADNWMARYVGYFTAPESGNYYFGTSSDDGSRIYLNGKTGTDTYQNDWVETGTGIGYGVAYYMSKGTSVPITAEFYEKGGAASFGLYVKGAVAEQVIPSSWLSTKINPLPAGWQLSVDADGDLAYDYASIQAQSIVLYDAQGGSHEYKYSATGKSYVPPVNEYGYLTRNANGTLTLIDSDGRVYNFDSAGRLTATSTPSDDRKPAALKYVYGGTPSRLTEIQDGADANRNGKVYYSGSSECGTVPSGFDSDAPANMICAFKTTDGNATYFYYKDKVLARVVSPGDVNTSLGYDSLGRIEKQQSSLAYDAIQAGVRQDKDGNNNPEFDELSQIEYDVIGRAKTITMPSANEDGFRAKHSYTYLTNTTLTNELGETEPNGYSQKVEYDALYRTVKSYDKAGLLTEQAWDPVKDLLQSSTDATGLKATTLYDLNDLPTDSYGPAPKEWFGADRKPLAAYVNQVPHTQNKYDEGLKGPAVAWFNFTNTNGGALVGAPKYHTTSFDPAVPDKFWQDTTSRPAPITKDAEYQGYGFSATGTLTVPSTGTYTFITYHDDAARLFVNNQLLVDQWAYRSDVITNGSGTIYLEANKPYRFKYDYANANNALMAFNVLIKGPGVDNTNSALWGDMIKPAYNLETTTKAFDASNGDFIKSTRYGAKPELGQAQAVTEDVGGLNLSTNYTYEPYQADSLMRQTSKTLPGGNTFTYQHYGANELRTNPCIAESEPVSQAGFAKGKSDPDPDSSGPLTGRTSEIVYGKSGNVVATRTNNDPWTCTEFDARGRTVKTQIPDYDGKMGRTVSYVYSFGGNPFIGAQIDSITGTSKVEIDLLGRTVKTTDSFGNDISAVYDNFGRMTEVRSLKGIEEYVYDNFDRVISYKLDGVKYANVSYDNYGEISSVEYPSSQNGIDKLKLSQLKKDLLGRSIGSTFTLSDGSIYNESVSLRQQSGLITGYSASYGSNTASATYQFDTVGRMIGSTIDTVTYTYGYGTQDASCAALAGANMLSGKNGNRTTYSSTNSVTGSSQSSFNCYDNADRLVASSDSQIGTPVYDDHGNIVQLAGNGVPINFSYNAADQNVSIEQGSNKVEYIKNAAGGVLVKKEYRDGILDKVYRNTAGVMQVCDTNAQALCLTADIYVALPGGVGLTLKNSTESTNATYSIKNFHGDTALTVGEDGLATSSVYMYEPFGQTVDSSSFGTSSNPNNSSNVGMGWAANPARKSENMFTISIIQMGARVYLPSLGRFIQVDPIEGGAANSYAYALDPINFADYSGQWNVPWKKIAIGAVAAIAVVGAVAACIAFCAPGAVATAVGTAITVAVNVVRVAAVAVIPKVAAKLTKVAPAVKTAGSKSGSSQQVTQAVKSVEAESKYFKPGPYATQSIPARGPQQTFNAAERKWANSVGVCHTCGATSAGTKSGNFVLDHQPVTSINFTGGPQVLYPQCITCSRVQGSEVAKYLRGLGDGF